jgi:outer membrane biogenesis lipoprotein LolB
MANQQGAVMNKMKKLAVAVLASAGLSACATTQVTEARNAEGTAPASTELVKVSRPMQSYGNLGGYRIRRLEAVSVPAS